MSFSGSVWFLVPGGTHGTLSFMARVLARVGFLVPGGRDTWDIVLHGLVLVRVGFLVPGGTHGTLSFMVWY